MITFAFSTPSFCLRLHPESSFSSFTAPLLIPPLSPSLPFPISLFYCHSEQCRTVSLRNLHLLHLLHPSLLHLTCLCRPSFCLLLLRIHHSCSSSLRQPPPHRLYFSGPEPPPPTSTPPLSPPSLFCNKSDKIRDCVSLLNSLHLNRCHVEAAEQLTSHIKPPQHFNGPPISSHRILSGISLLLTDCGLEVLGLGGELWAFQQIVAICVC